jgi:DNA-binding MarR family transcriptional regulator
MGLTRQSVQRTADRLHAEGLVRQADNPAHRRAKLVTLTARGRSILDWITQQQIAWANELAIGLAETDLRHTLSVIRAFRDSLEDAAGRHRAGAGASSPSVDRENISPARARTRR